MWSRSSTYGTRPWFDSHLEVGLEALDEEPNLLQVDVDPVLEGVGLEQVKQDKNSYTPM